MGTKIGKKNKHISQKKHAIRRCNERLDLQLSDHDYDELVDKIKNNEAVFHSKQSNRISRFKINVKGTETIAVYDKQRKTIVTFLTDEIDPIFEEIFGWTKPS